MRSSEQDPIHTLQSPASIKTKSITIKIFILEQQTPHFISDLSDFVTFESDTFLYDGPLDLTEYHIKHIGMTALNDTLRVKIVIDRRLLSLVLTAFIPTIILNIIGHMSNYFKEDFFEGLMSLNVTVMLVLTTMFLRFVFIQLFVSIY